MNRDNFDEFMRSWEEADAAMEPEPVDTDINPDMAWEDLSGVNSVIHILKSLWGEDYEPVDCFEEGFGFLRKK